MPQQETRMQAIRATHVNWVMRSKTPITQRKKTIVSPLV